MVEIKALVTVTIDFDERETEDGMVESISCDFELMMDAHIINYMKLVLANPDKYAHVQTINFSECNITIGGLQKMECMFYEPFQVCCLKISDVDITHKEMEWIANLLQNPYSSLRHIELSIQRPETVAPLVHALCSSTCHLKILSISVGNEDMIDSQCLFDGLAAVLAHQKLVELRVYGYRAYDLVPFANALASNHTLKDLQILRADLSERRLQPLIDALQINTHLKSLYVQGNNIRHEKLFLDMVSRNRMMEEICFSYDARPTALKRALYNNQQHKNRVTSQLCALGYISPRVCVHLLWDS